MGDGAVTGSSSIHRRVATAKPNFRFDDWTRPKGMGCASDLEQISRALLGSPSYKQALRTPKHDEPVKAHRELFPVAPSVAFELELATFGRRFQGSRQLMLGDPVFLLRARVFEL